MSSTLAPVPEASTIGESALDLDTLSSTLLQVMTVKDTVDSTLDSTPLPITALPTAQHSTPPHDTITELTLETQNIKSSSSAAVHSPAPAKDTTTVVANTMHSYVLHWHMWTSWTPCSTSCGGGTRTHVRLCATADDPLCSKALITGQGRKIGE